MNQVFDTDNLQWNQIQHHGVDADESIGWSNGLKVRTAIYRLGAGKKIPEHAHEGWVHVAVLKGEMEFETQEHGKQRITAGHNYYVEPGQSHYESAPDSETIILLTHAFMPGMSLQDA